MKRPNNRYAIFDVKKLSFLCVHFPTRSFFPLLLGHFVGDRISGDTDIVFLFSPRLLVCFLRRQGIVHVVPMDVVQYFEKWPRNGVYLIIDVPLLAVCAPELKWIDTPVILAKTLPLGIAMLCCNHNRPHYTIKFVNMGFVSNVIILFLLMGSLVPS